MDNIELIESDISNSNIITPSMGISNQISVINNCKISNSEFLLVGDLKDSTITNVPKGSTISNSSNCKLTINYSESIKSNYDNILNINLVNCLPGSELIIEGNPIIVGTITIIGKVTIKDFAVVNGDVRLENCVIGGYANITNSHIPFDVTRLEIVNTNLLLDTPQFIGDKYTLVKDESTGLFRVKALKSFGTVSKGDTGGLVSGFYNLSQEGNCWIDKDSVVEHKSKVLGDYTLPSNCHLKGKVTLKDCTIKGNIRLCGDIKIYDCSIESQGATVSGRMDISNSTIKAKGYAIVNSSQREVSDTSFINIDSTGFSVKSREDWYSYLGTE